MRWPNTAFGGAAPDRGAALLVDVQPLPGPPSVDDGVDAGDHGLHVVLDLSVAQPGRHDAAPAAVVVAVADDQRGGPVDQGQILERLPPAERVGVGKHELVCLGAQQVGVATPPGAGIDHRAPPPIQRQQRLAGRIAHRPIPSQAC
jgi:hypothetical protein